MTGVGVETLDLVGVTLVRRLSRPSTSEVVDGRDEEVEHRIGRFGPYNFRSETNSPLSVVPFAPGFGGPL